MAYNSSGFRVSVMPQTNFLDPRLFAPQSGFLSGANQGIATAGQLGSLADTITSRQRVVATQADAIAAENARNKYLATKSLADLPNIQSSAQLAGLTNQLGIGQTQGQLANIGTQQELDAATLQTAAAEAARKKTVLAQTTEPRTNTDILNADLALGAAQTATASLPGASEAAIAKSKVDAITANQALSDAEATQQIMEADPNMRIADLKATITARRAARDAELARSRAQVAAGGLTPGEAIATENQKRLGEYNAAQIDVARQKAANDALKIQAVANDPLKMAKVHLEVAKSKLSNGETIEEAIGSKGPHWYNWAKWSPNDQQQIDNYIQSSSNLARTASGMGAAPAPAPAAPGPYSAFEGKTLNGPGGAKVKILNGNPVPIK